MSFLLLLLLDAGKVRSNAKTFLLRSFWTFAVYSAGDTAESLLSSPVSINTPNCAEMFSNSNIIGIFFSES